MAEAQIRTTIPARRITSAAQLLEIDFAEYDRILLVPNDGRDWQWERDKAMFSQAALKCGVSFDDLIEKTKPCFGELWLPPDVTSAVIDMGEITLPTLDKARQTPEEWGAAAKSQCADLIDQLVEFQRAAINGELKSGALIALPRRRKALIDDQTAMAVAAKYFFFRTRWSELAKEYPPKGGYTGNPAAKRKQRDKRESLIQVRVTDILHRLKLRTLK